MRPAGSAIGAALLAALLLLAAPARAQEGDRLTGTLKAARDRGALVIGYRTDAMPFSYLDGAGQPAGYALDLCREVLEEAAASLGRPLGVQFVPVTAENRLAAVAEGRVDVECGATTANTERRKQVSFSPVYFVAGTKLLVPTDSAIRSYRDLANRTVAVTAGTTNEVALRAIQSRQGIALRVVSAPDHPGSFALLRDGKAEALAGDDVLLAAQVAALPVDQQRRWRITGEYLSYDPYGLVLRRDDPQFQAVVDRAFARMAEGGTLRSLYLRWFRRRLPTGGVLDLPMSPQLEEMFRALGQPD